MRTANKKTKRYSGGNFSVRRTVKKAHISTVVWSHRKVKPGTSDQCACFGAVGYLYISECVVFADTGESYWYWYGHFSLVARVTFPPLSSSPKRYTEILRPSCRWTSGRSQLGGYQPMVSWSLWTANLSLANISPPVPSRHKHHDLTLSLPSSQAQKSTFSAR